MRVSVIVAARNSRTTIAACVEAILGQRAPGVEADLLVVDDGSTDETAELAARHGARVLSIPPSGPAVARNRGVAATAGDLVVFTDADCAPDPDWLARMVAPFVSEDVTATKGVYRTEQRSLTARFVQYEYESRYERMRRQDSIDFIDTYAAAFRRRLFDRAGGFDESFPHPSVEDQEFSFRYARLGGRMVFVADAVVRHRHADSPLAYFRKKLKIASWKVRVMRRHPDKIVSDSHTPPGLKIEVLAALVGMVALPLAWTPIGLGVLIGALAVLAICAAPLVVRIGARDPVVGLVAPGLVALRAIALATGSLRGVVGLTAGPLPAGEATAAGAAPDDVAAVGEAPPIRTPSPDETCSTDESQSLREREEVHELA